MICEFNSAFFFSIIFLKLIAIVNIGILLVLKYMILRDYIQVTEIFNTSQGLLTITTTKKIPIEQGNETHCHMSVLGCIHISH